MKARRQASSILRLLPNRSTSRYAYNPLVIFFFFFPSISVYCSQPRLVGIIHLTLTDPFLRQVHIPPDNSETDGCASMSRDREPQGDNVDSHQITRELISPSLAVSFIPYRYLFQAV